MVESSDVLDNDCLVGPAWPRSTPWLWHSSCHQKEQLLPKCDYVPTLDHSRNFFVGHLLKIFSRNSRYCIFRRTFAFTSTLKVDDNVCTSRQGSYHIRNVKKFLWRQFHTGWNRDKKAASDGSAWREGTKSDIVQVRSFSNNCLVCPSPNLIRSPI